MGGKEQLIVVKVGGSIIENQEQCKKLLDAFVSIKSKKVLVHGGGKIATKLADQLGIPTTMKEGRRITDDQMIDIVIMSYAGLINKRLVAQLGALGTSALGLTGADANAIVATKRPERNGINFGWVGDVKSVNEKFIRAIFDQGIVPVFAPLTHDGVGHMLNTNADTIASEVAIALSTNYSVTLNYIFDLKGVLRDINDESSLIKSINIEEYARLKYEGVVSSGMIPKLDNAFATIERGVSSVNLLEASSLSSMSDPMFGEYTKIQ